ncbi:hypothetical protein ACTFIW_006386 [Dictyostelium discoideum]
MIRGLYKSFSKSSSSLSICSFTNEKSKSFLNAVVSQSSKNYCTTNGEEKPKLRHVLKKFYLMIHPDTLTQHPNEKHANSNSMKALMSIVDEYKKRPTPDSQTKRNVQKLTFYVPEDKISGEEAPTSIGDRKFKIIESEFCQYSNNPNHIPNQIRLLFEQCKLPTNFLTEIDNVDNVIQPTIDGSLQNFILDNKHYIKKKLQISEKHKSELDALVRKIKRDLRVGVTIETNPVDSSFTFQENYHALLHFQNVVKEWRDKVAADAQDGSEIVTSGQFKFNLNYNDINFTVPELCCYLDRSSPDTWAEYLNKLNLSLIKAENLEFRKSEEAKFKIMKKESEEARSNFTILEKLLKCRSFQLSEHDDPSEDPNLYLDTSKQITQSLAFTSMLIKNKSKLENLMKTRLKKVKFGNIAVVANLHKSKFWVDIDGNLKINPNVTFEEFCDILESQHKIANEKDILSHKYESIRDYAQVRMGLKTLNVLSVFTYTHDHQKVFDAYQKLYDAADRLRDLDLSGFSIIIADHYNITKSGNLIIKYDFNTEDLIKQLSAATKDVKEEDEEEEEPIKQQEDIKIDLTNISNVLEQYENQSKSNNKTL